MQNTQIEKAILWHSFTAHNEKTSGRKKQKE